MADFCLQCSLEVYGEDSRDLADFISVDEDGEIVDPYVLALCEGCGYILVDNDGRCSDPRCVMHANNGKSKCDLDPWTKRIWQFVNKMRDKAGLKVR